MTITLDRLRRHATRFRPYVVDPAEDFRAQMLWVAVLLQAVRDATASEPDPSGDIPSQDVQKVRDVKRVIKRQSRAWFMYPNPDFFNVCMMAGFDPIYVRERVSRLITFKDRLHRMIAGVRGYGGYFETFENTEGTGGGSRKSHFDACGQLQSGASS